MDLLKYRPNKEFLLYKTDIRNIFESGELDEKVVSSILELTTQHGAIVDKSQSNTSN